MKDLKPEL